MDLTNPVILIIMGAILFVLGIIIGRIPVRDLKRTANSLLASGKSWKSEAETTRRELNSEYRIRESFETRYHEAKGIAERFHGLLGCKNGDSWSDHTDVQPAGLTPARRREIKAEEKRLRDAAEASRLRDEKERQEREKKRAEEAKRTSSRRSSGYMDGGVGLIAASTFDGGGFSGGGGDCGGGGGGGDCG